jgi:hypothetical protein
LKNLYTLFILITNFVFSQNILEIKVVDQNNSPLFRAIVIVEQNNTQISFGNTNQNGIFITSLTNGDYSIKINKLGFVSQIKNVTIIKNTSLSVGLVNETNSLETVVIKYRPKIMKVKQDTISYNLKTVVNGTERKIEDVIKKLPGLNVDENGKVSFKGETIDNVLIDGNEFFGNKHQMATKNIDANMIEGIDLLTNYQGFSKLGMGAKGIALNLKLKENYRQKFIGDIEASYGINDATRMHNNLFKFSKKGNLAIISDYNTISKSPITMDDYREMRVSKDNENDQSNVETFELPSFLATSNFIKLKKNSFVGVNYTSFLGEKSKIAFLNLFNNTNMIEESSKTQTNIGQINTIAFFNSNKKSGYTLNNTDFKWEFNKSKNTFISYRLNITPNKDEIDENIINFTNQIVSNTNDTNFILSQAVKINSVLNQKLNYKFQFNHSIENNQKEISIRSNSPLFGLSVNKAKQSLNFENNNYSILNEFNYKKGKSNLISKLLLLHKNSSSINSNIIDGNEYGLLRNQNTLQAQFLWQNLWGSKWRTSLGIKSTNNFIHLDHNKSDYSVIEPYFMINYAISQFHKIGLSSDFSHDFPSLFQLQNRLLIDDFQSIKSASVVGFNNPINKKGINFDYLNINIKNQSILFSKISYSIFDKSIVQNTIYDTRFIKSNYLFSPKTSQFQWFTLYDLRFNSLPFSIKNSFVYMNTNSFSYFDSVENQTKIQNISAKQQFLTNFKNSIFQIDLGYNFNNVFTSQSVSNFTNNNNSFQLFFTLKGKYKEKVKWDIGWVFNNQNSGLNQNKIHFLNCNGELNLTKKIKLVIAGFNLLNLNNNKFIATDNNPSFFTESINQIMPGYLMSGLNFSF